jgi:hypothetical protein
VRGQLGSEFTNPNTGDHVLNPKCVHILELAWGFGPSP